MLALGAWECDGPGGLVAVVAYSVSVSATVAWPGIEEGSGGYELNVVDRAELFPA